MSEVDSEVDTAAFRAAAGQFASGIVVVTTRDGHAMTVSAFTSVSLDPPLVLFCAEKIARFHDAVVAGSGSGSVAGGSGGGGTWAVSILPADAEKTARWLATRGRPMEGQLDRIPHHPGSATGAPLLDAALATFECRTTAVHDGGDHSIVVGKVIAVTVLPASHAPAPNATPTATPPTATPPTATRSTATRPTVTSAPTASSGPLIHYAAGYHRIADR